MADFDVADDEDCKAEWVHGLLDCCKHSKRGRGPLWSDFGAASEAFEVGVAVAAALDVHAFAVGQVEACFEHAATGIEQEETERTEMFSPFSLFAPGKLLSSVVISLLLEESTG